MIIGRKRLFKGVRIPTTQLPDDEPQNFARVGMTPTIFDLEEALKLLSKADPINVAMTRTQLKWLLKECNKSFGVQYRHPYRGGQPKA